MTEKLHLEDLNPGDVFKSGEYTLEADEIKTFARQYDPQPFHLDEEAARDTFFQGLAASGWHTCAITMRLFVESVPIAGGLIGAGSDVAWSQPTRPGDVLHVVSTILDITPSRSKPDRGIVTIQSDTVNQRDELCQRAVSRVLAFRRG
ncbi:MaoC family dehydratase [Betaproteobacteria bacterium]|nr:MaoC family dehydratase [Betaproteobacteria bacterium]GHU43228.1 MaoC family dehydratase [Betaproteobacteria bacterium]